jgi:hypothetical protein
LDQCGQTGTKGIDPPFSIDAHLFLCQFFLVLGIFLLDVLPFLVILQVLHSGCALHLLGIQGPCHNTDENGEEDNGKAEVVPDNVIDPQQNTGKYGNKKIPHSSS